MAYTSSDLSLMASTGAGSGHKLFFYTNTAVDTVTASGFFNALVDTLHVGDLIYVVNLKQFIYVATNNGSVITTALVIQPST